MRGEREREREKIHKKNKRQEVNSWVNINEYGMAYKAQGKMALICPVLYFERIKLFWCNANHRWCGYYSAALNSLSRRY